MFVPAVNKANMLRGAFGHTFRRLCCVPQCANARACPLGTETGFVLGFMAGGLWLNAFPR